MQPKTILNHFVGYKSFVIHKVELIGEIPIWIEIEMRSRVEGQRS